MIDTAGPSTRESVFRRELEAWEPRDPQQDRLRRDYLDLLSADGPSPLDRGFGREHLTASCFVLTSDLTSILLCFHGRGRFWVQFGGHIEPDDRSVAAAALREAIEESGLAGLAPASESLADLDRHALGAGFRSCDVHWDVGFVAFAPLDATPVVSDESEAVAWWPVDALPAEVPAGFAQRLERVLLAAREQHGEDA